MQFCRYSETEADCTLALSLDPTYTKAYLRRGTARNALGKAASARKDFFDALKLEPGNAQARTELKKLDEVETKQEKPKMSKVSTPGVKNSKYIQPIYKQPKLRSKKPLMRIEVQEIGFEEDPKLEAQSFNIDDILGRNLGREISETVNLKESSQESPVQNPRISVLSEIQSSEKKKAVMGVTNGEGSLEPSTQEAMFPRCEHSMVCNSTFLTNGHSDRSIENDKAFDGESKKMSIPPPPTTSFQFQSDVKKLHHSSFELYQYLQQIGPSRLPMLLKQQLETETLLPILDCFKDVRDEIILDYLTQFTKVKRFEMAIMFMTNEEKQGVGKLFKGLTGLYPLRAEEILTLQRKYGL